MDDVFALCAFQTPLEGSLDALKVILRAGMPPNIKYGELREGQTEFEPNSGLLHLICRNATTPEQIKVAEEMIDVLFEYGANWMLLDDHNMTPGDIAYESKKKFYEKFVRAGVRSEIVLQQLLEDSDEEEGEDADEENVPELTNTDETKTAYENEAVEGHNKKFLASELKYDDKTLQTNENDGVMMDWETPIMKKSAEMITKPGGSVLNIGFGMGIIDGFIQELGPKTHYIVEAHPDVLKRMRETGWYEKPNVIILEGTWKAELPKLLDQHVTLDGIYYDTFSEHYKDMLQLFDYVVGLLSMDGTFSYFNGLGADRQVCYDVYKEVAKYNLLDYGLNIEFVSMPLDISDGIWKDIKREYFKLDEYALPIVTFGVELEEEEGELIA